MKNKIIKILIIIALILSIVFVAFRCYRMFKDYQYNRMIERAGIPGVKIFSPDQVLCGVFEKVDYNKLELTENFKTKYPDREKIIKGISKYDFFSSGYEDSDCIFITANVLDIFGNIKNDDLTIYYFEYTTKDNLLDDVKLIKKRLYDPIENKVLEEEIYE